MGAMPERPLPPHFAPARAARVSRFACQERSRRARALARAHGVRPAAEDEVRLGLLLIDVQNTFCLPEFELYVRGRSGTGAVDDNRRLADFIYRNLGRITRIVATLDRSEEHTSELQSRENLVCRLLLE